MILVTVNIGSLGNMKKYTVYREFASYYSPVLAAAFKPGFLEGTTQEITLDDVDEPNAFGTVQAWMYGHEFDAAATLAGLECINLICAWMLADRLLMPDLQNDIMRRLMYQSLDNEQVADVNWLYEKTGPGSKLRAWFVDKCALELDSAVWVEVAGREGTVRQFAIDIALACKSDSKTNNQSIHLFPGISPLKTEDYLVCR